MIKKFEIKSHDGPGRICKIDGELTPKLFFKDDSSQKNKRKP